MSKISLPRKVLAVTAITSGGSWRNQHIAPIDGLALRCGHWRSPHIEGKDTDATIDTTGAASGSYTATARVSDPEMKKGGEASCTSNFTLKPLNPPQISCSANPRELQAPYSAESLHVIRATVTRVASASE